MAANIRRFPAGLTVVCSVAIIGFFLLLSHGAPASEKGSLSTEPTRTVEIGDNEIYVTIADTEALREKGLGGRSGLAPDEGMLFVFQQDGQYQFWMKDMRFSIDILWLDKNGKVVYIQPNLSPDTYPNSFGPKELSRYVLEVPAGFARANNVHIGDIVKI